MKLATRRGSYRIAGVLIAALVVAASVVAVLRWMRVGDEIRSVQPAIASVRSLQLYCQFYVFTEQRPRVGFLFVVERDGDRSAFRQLYVAEDNGERTDFDGAERPTWRLDDTVQPPRILSTIDVPDASQAARHQEDIAIELYRYDAARDSPVWFEASLKNIHFQNLPGKCRQSAT